MPSHSLLSAKVRNPQRGRGDSEQGRFARHMQGHHPGWSEWNNATIELTTDRGADKVRDLDMPTTT